MEDTDNKATLAYVEHRYSDGTIKRLTDSVELDYYHTTIASMALFAHIHDANPFDDRPVAWEVSKTRKGEGK